MAPHWKMQFTFQILRRCILLQRDGKSVSMDPQEFCTAVNRKSHWEATIYVMREPYLLYPDLQVPYL